MRTFDKDLWGKSIWLLLLLGLPICCLLSYCNPLRHYNKVASDQYPRSEKKRKIIGPVCAVEFPAKVGEPELKKTEIDSSAYNALKSSNTALLQQYIRLQDSIYRLQPTPENKALKDSATYVLNFLKTYAPPAIVDVRYYERKVMDSAKENQLTRERDDWFYKHLQVSAQFTAKDKDLEEKKKELKAALNWKLYFWLLVAAAGLALVLILFSKFKRK